MKTFSLKLLSLLPIMTLICSCGNNLKYIDNYVGTYKVTTGFENVYRYRYGVEELKSSKELPGILSIITINKNGEVIMRDKDGIETKGGINTSEKNCNFTGLSINSGFKFIKYKNDNNKWALDHSYTSSRVGFEYDYTTRRYIMVEYFDPTDFKNVVGDYKISISTYRKDKYKGGNPQTISSSKNYNSLLNAVVNIKDDKTLSLTTSAGINQTGSVTMEKATLKFKLDSQTPLIRDDMGFIFNTEQKSFSLYSTFSIKDSESLTDYTIEYFSISMEKI